MTQALIGLTLLDVLYMNFGDVVERGKSRNGMLSCSGPRSDSCFDGIESGERRLVGGGIGCMNVVGCLPFWSPQCRGTTDWFASCG